MQPEQLTIIESPEQFDSNHSRKVGMDNPGVVLCKLGGGILRFTDFAFPGADPENIFAQYFEREPEGRGPHFDLYGEQLNLDYPWLALFNLKGVASLRATALPQDLATAYFHRWPEPNDQAYAARRPLSALALSSPDAIIREGELDVGVGMLLSQRANGPHIVHEITPRSSYPGRFIKMVAIQDVESSDYLEQHGYVNLDRLLTTAMGTEESYTRSEDVPTQSAGATQPATPLPTEKREPPHRRSCSLD